MNFLGAKYVYPLTIETTTRDISVRAVSDRLVTVRSKAHRFIVTVGLEPDSTTLNSSALGARLRAHMGKYGSHTAFDFTMPIEASNNDGWKLFDSVSVASHKNTAIEASSLSLRLRYTHAVDITVPSGTMLTIPGGDKIYELADDLVLPARNNVIAVVTANINPTLRTKLKRYDVINTRPVMKARWPSEIMRAAHYGNGLTRPVITVEESVA